MTRARNRTHGLGNPPLIQLLLEAALCVFVSLVQGAATTLKMIFTRRVRDWHTAPAHEDLPQATSGIHDRELSQTSAHMRCSPPPLAKGRSDLRHADRGGDHASPRALIACVSILPRLTCARRVHPARRSSAPG